MFKGSGLGLCPRIRATGSSAQGRCQAQAARSWNSPVAYSHPACTGEKDLTPSVSRQKCGSLLLGHGSKNRTSFQGRSARLKLTEQNGKCVREGKAENGPSRSSGRSHSPLQPAMPRNKAAPGLPRGSLAGRLWDSPAKSSQREVEPGVGGVANTGRGVARGGGLSLSPPGSPEGGAWAGGDLRPKSRGLGDCRGHAGEGEEAGGCADKGLEVPESERP